MGIEINEEELLEELEFNWTPEYGASIYVSLVLRTFNLHIRWLQRFAEIHHWFWTLFEDDC
jgi:hypothetical protein